MKRGEYLARRLHEFEEDVEDYSMCLCGVPAMTHECVEPATSTPGASVSGPTKGNDDVRM